MFPDQIRRVCRFFITKYPRMPLFFVGHSGIGKSMMARESAKECGSYYVRLNATGMEPTDCIGLPKLVDDMTRWLPPAILKPLEKEKSSVLNFDEINRVPTETRHTLMQALDERQLGELKLAAGCQIILTANPDDPGYQVDDLDTAFIRRCCVLPVEFSFDAFREWAMTEYTSPQGLPISARALGAMGRNQRAFAKDIKGMDKFRQTATPDGVVRCSELEQVGIYDEFKPEEVIQIFSGIVGNAVATSIVKDLNDNELKKLKLKLDKFEKIEVAHAIQIDLLYWAWQDYGTKPAAKAKEIFHMFTQLDNDIKLLLVKMCAKYFNKKETASAFMPLRAEWKKIMSEQMLRSKNVDEDEVKSLLQSLGQ